MRRSIHLSGILAVALLAGCARFEPKPISPEATANAWDRRSLADPGLRGFLETNGVVSAWPRTSWDLDTLTLAAFYYHPDLELARARWHAAAAGKATARQRPNPNLSLTPRFNSTSAGTGITPWILGGVLDIPVETMGKRKYRIAQAQHLDEMARLDLAGTAWRVRSRVRASCLALQAARDAAALLREHAAALGRVARLMEAQWEAGAVSLVDVATARAARDRAQLGLKETGRQEADARGQLAAAVGVPVDALEGRHFAWPDLGSFPTNLQSGEVRRQAVLNRADVLSALAEYAASESALQVQIARQYPDLHLRPGYELDQTKNKWQLGVSIELPLLHQNRGPIAEAEAKREEIAAKFNGIQARALGEIDRAVGVYLAAVEQTAAAAGLRSNLEQRRAGLARSYEAGEVDGLAVATAQAEAVQGAWAQLQARVQAQQALAALEDAVQSPILMPLPPARLETAARVTDPPSKP